MSPNYVKFRFHCDRCGEKFRYSINYKKHLCSEINDDEKDNE